MNGLLRVLIVRDSLPPQNKYFKFLTPINFTYFTTFTFWFISSVHLMPIMVLACEMCPKNVEATFYSF